MAEGSLRFQHDEMIENYELVSFLFHPISKFPFASRSILALSLLASLLSLTGTAHAQAADSASVRPAGVTKTAAGQTTHTHYPKSFSACATASLSAIILKGLFKK